MRVPIDWLAELVELPPDTGELAGRLTEAGLEVEAVERFSVPDRVVAGAVLEVRPHPRADLLRTCRVAIGDGEALDVVCGAPDVEARRTVAVALPGAVLASGVVEVREIRGITSSAMLCSEHELGLSEEHAGLLELVPADLAPGGAGKGPGPGVPLAALLPTLSVLDVAVSPNRGDCLSILGMAREVSALWGTKLRARRQATPVAEEEEQGFVVGIEAHELCSWYCAQRFAAPNAAIAPLWMRRRLVVCGLRPISPAVDVTNYVLLERGQPLHAFDLERLHGGRLVARRARPGETLRLLDGREPTLTPEDLVIADAREAVALAGVMGGAGSEVGVETRRIVLESAVFAPSAVRRTARRVGAQSEASFRFERGVDPSGAAAAIARAATLLAGLGGRPIGRLLEAGGPAADPPPIAVVPKRLNALLGTTLESQEMVRRLRAIGAAVRRTHGETIEVIAPVHRSDLRQPADLAEEIARVGGYAAIPTIQPRIPAQARPGAGSGVRRLQASFAAHGFSETVLLAFAEPGDNERFPGLWATGTGRVELRNPLATVARELRRSLLPGLLGALRVNQAYGASFVALFSVGTVFARDADGAYLERPEAAALVWGTPPAAIGRPAEPVGFVDVKRIVERVLGDLDVPAPRWTGCTDASFLHPGRSAVVWLDGHRVGRVGAVHPTLASQLDMRDTKLWLVELDPGRLLEGRRPTPRYVEPPRFPAVERDVALVVDQDVPAQSVVDALLGQGESLVEKIELFDEYRGAGVPEGRKSLAYAISYRARDRTLTDAEVNAAHEGLLRGLAARLRFERRGVGSS